MEKARLIVLTDIGPWDAEPDDAQSLVRLLLYANEYDIVGIIPNASWCRPDTSGDDFLRRITDVVRAYGKVRKNLCVHAEGYPEEEYLLSVVKRGISHVNMRRDATMGSFLATRPDIGDKKTLLSDPKHRKDFFRYLEGCVEKNVGEGCSCEGAELIKAELLSGDARPLWVALWGGSGTLAQALFQLRESLPEEKLHALCSKLRVYDIHGQCDCGAWIMHHFPAITWYRATTSFWGFSETPFRYPEGFGKHVYCGEVDCVLEPWLREHVQSIGALGEVYPSARFGMETDTPSFLGLVQNGLSDPNHLEWGGWGGRFTRVQFKNLPGEFFTLTYLQEQKPFFMFSDDADMVFAPHLGRNSKSTLAGTGRWMKDYQNDMAARMQWSVSNRFSDCNHNPVAVLCGDQTKDAVILAASAGSKVCPDTEGTSDPDGDNLSYRWYVYPEAGTYFKNIKIEKADTASPVIHVPEDAEHDEIHVILEVTDDGSPQLKSYRRLVIRTGDTGLEGEQLSANDSEFVYSGSWGHKTEQYGCYNGDIHLSDLAGDQAVLPFSGNRIMLFGMTVNDSGIAAVSIDGQEEILVDGYSHFNRWQDQFDSGDFRTPPALPFYLSPYLESGEHTLTLRVTGDKNDLSTGAYIFLDRAVIFRKK